MILDARLQRLAQRLRERGEIPVRFALWNGRQIDLSPAPQVTIRVPTPGSVRYLLRPSLASLGEAYVEGHLDVDGPLDAVIRVGSDLARQGAPETARGRRSLFPRRHTRRRDAGAISYHYDVSNDFYALWLDRRMVYSCAYFRTGDEDIDTAQEQKLDHICRKLMLRPGERFLDVGCGWGALVRWAARHYGVQATGITLSRRQHECANARIGAEGLEGRCRVLFMDYRDLPADGGYDKIASVGMFEHVGLKNLAGYFGIIERALRPGGMVMNHGITAMDPDSRWVGLGAGEFIDRYVFPDGELPHLALAIGEMSRQNLEVTDVESLRMHYAKTLWHWARRLDAQRDRAAALAGEKAFRIWQVYLAGCAHAFEQGWVSIHQILAVKNAAGASPMPWTRDYMYADEQPAPRAAAAAR